LHKSVSESALGISATEWGWSRTRDTVF